MFDLVYGFGDFGNDGRVEEVALAPHVPTGFDLVLGGQGCINIPLRRSFDRTNGDRTTVPWHSLTLPTVRLRETLVGERVPRELAPVTGRRFDAGQGPFPPDRVVGAHGGGQRDDSDVGQVALVGVLPGPFAGGELVQVRTGAFDFVAGNIVAAHELFAPLEVAGGAPADFGGTFAVDVRFAQLARDTRGDRVVGEGLCHHGSTTAAVHRQLITCSGGPDLSPGYKSGLSPTMKGERSGTV